METLSPEVIEDLRHGRAPRERKLAICTGGGHLPPADRAEILAVLASDADEMVSSRAQDAILSQPVESFVEALKREHALPALQPSDVTIAYLPAGCSDATCQSVQVTLSGYTHVPIIPFVPLSIILAVGPDFARRLEMPLDTFACPQCRAVLRRSLTLQPGDPVMCPRCHRSARRVGEGRPGGRTAAAPASAGRHRPAVCRHLCGALNAGRMPANRRQDGYAPQHQENLVDAHRLV